MQRAFFRGLGDHLQAAIRTIVVTTVILQGDYVASVASESGGGAASTASDSRAAIDALEAYLAVGRDARPELAGQPFAATPLSREDSQQAGALMWQDHAAHLRQSRAGELEARQLVEGPLKMPFYYRVFGEKPRSGRSMFISMHGGGNAPAPLNDRQWENQKGLYRLDEGVYVVPRAPTNTWDLWHQSHIDKFFGRLIEDFIVLEDVDPDRVYLMGYSAGGDGVYQLAPRMADRLAAAAMMAGHPNETSPLGLRNLPFTIHVGGRDAAYKRNEIARQWGKQLDELRERDPEGYVHWVQIYPDKSHWMDREDAAAVAWMAQYRRNMLPSRVVWKQDDVVHKRFYWLAVDPEDIESRAEVTANRQAQAIDVRVKGVKRLTVLLNDDMLDMDQTVIVKSQNVVLFEGPVTRTIGMIAKTLQQRGDPRGIFSGEVTVDIAAEADQ